MATVQGITGSKEAAIIARMIHPQKDDVPDHDIARAMLRMRLDQSDLDRLHDLIVENRDDALTPAKALCALKKDG